MSSKMLDMTPSKHETDCLIVGGGIVGICCGLELLASGKSVTIIEANKPGYGASYGNAGCLAFSEIVPISVPGLIRHVPGWLMDPLGPLSLRWRYFPKLIPWLWRFNQAGNNRQVDMASTAQTRLMKFSIQAWKEYAASYSLDQKIKWNGKIVVYETEKGFQGDRAYWNWCEKRNVPYQLLSADDIREMEPGLSCSFHKGILTPDYAHVTDPYEILKDLMQQFKNLGGKIFKGRTHGFQRKGNRINAVILEDGSRITFQQAVIAAGIWSKKIVRDLGYDVLLESERGYNTSLPNAQSELTRPIMFGERHFVISPLESGLRIGGAAEFAGLEDAPNFQRSKNLLKIALNYLPDLDTTDRQEWMGPRPSTPDSLAVIGTLPDHNNILLAFGHGHLGLTQAPATAKIITKLAQGQAPEIDISEFSIERFN